MDTGLQDVLWTKTYNNVHILCLTLCIFWKEIKFLLILIWPDQITKVTFHIISDYVIQLNINDH